MPSATASPAFDCPKCRAALPPAAREEGEVALHTCSFCDTVVLRTNGELRIAGRQQERDTNVDWLHALCCRLCGGSLSQSAAAAAEKARCAYCGHLARLRPGLISVLRLLFRDPKLVPPSLRRRVLFSFAIVLATIGMTAFMVVQEPGWRLEKFEVNADTAQVGEVVYDKVIDIPGFPTMLGVEADRHQNHSGLSLDAFFVHQYSETCLALDAHSRPHSYGSSSTKIPGGKTRVVVKVKEKSAAAEKTKQEKNTKAAAFYSTMRSKLSLGYMILALNILLWLSIAVIKFGVDFQSTKRRGAQITQGLSLLFLAYWFSMTILNFDPLGPRRFAPDDTASFTKHGLACEALIKKEPSLPPNAELIAAMDQAVELTNQRRAGAWQGLAAVLSEATPDLSSAPCVTNVEYALNKHSVEVVQVKEFQQAGEDWMPELSENTITARGLARWRGKLAADESPAQSLLQAEAWKREVDIDDQALLFVDEAPDGKRARLLVWSYKKGELLCAAPPTQIASDEEPHLDALLGTLRALSKASPSP